MRRAVTLIELIFVMVILGVLTGLGFGFVKTDTTYRDGEAVLLKLKQARYKAMGYEGRLDEGCLELERTKLSDTASKAGGYKLSSEVDASDGITNLCFDSLGRPHGEDNVNLSSLLSDNLDINITKGSDSCTVRVFRQSGYAIIACD